MIVSHVAVNTGVILYSGLDKSFNLVAHFASVYFTLNTTKISMDQLVRFTADDLLQAYRSGKLKGTDEMNIWLPEASDDQHRRFILRLMILKVSNQLTEKNLEKEFVKIYTGRETLEADNAIPDECQAALTTLMAASDRNQNAKNEYNAKLRSWQAQIDELQYQHPERKNQRNEYESDLWTPCFATEDRDARFRSSCANWYGGSPIFRWDGTYDKRDCGWAWERRGRCSVDLPAETSKWQSQYDNLNSQKPREPQYETLGNFNCLKCSQDIQVANGGIVDADKLEQRMSCYIGEKQTSTSTPTVPATTTSAAPATTTPSSNTNTFTNLTAEQKKQIGLVILVVLCILCIIVSSAYAVSRKN